LAPLIIDVTTTSAVPRHVAIVMDGNGRWARKRMMPRLWGHKKGVDALVKTILICVDRGIEHLTVFAFSSENWRRPPEEVSGLMKLIPMAMSMYLHKLAKLGVRIRVIGDRQGVAPKLIEAWDRAETLTHDNQRLTLNIAFNYGGRWDLLQACQRAMASGLSPEQLDEAALGGFMCLSDAPALDLFIRTGGEMRISNFLLWQAAYAELYFTPCLWPDFDEAEMDSALADFARRERRFGGIKSSPIPLESGVS
jgi:undecaprenyl diphosphate synthase